MYGDFNTEILICFGVAGIAAVTDLLFGRIPNSLTYPAILSGLILGFITSGTFGLLTHFGAALFAAAPFLLAFVYGGGGGGDVKIMAAIGALIGFPDILSVLAHALLVGAIMAAGLILFEGRLRQVADRLKLAVLKLPLGLKSALDLEPVGLSEDHGSGNGAALKSGVRFGIAAAIGLYWTYTPGIWHLPGL
jgi:prepilin peptidase CpaA